MGLLDDAIREHLELKRRRGADPDEVAREEGDALGDPRSGEFAQPDAAPGEPDAAAVPEPEPPALGVDDEPAAAVEPEPWLEDERIDAQPTAESTAPDAEPEAVRPDGDEDVLEETPEFLQETPEHDRLWFEQKPPRNFDFDS